jgi:transcriptional regulator with XRE-family HTH domain
LNERIKELRKSMDFSQEEFGEKLGLSRSAISNMESGRYSITESLMKLICREFNVDYIWLTTGQGEMFADADIDIMTKIDRIMAGENDTAKRVFTSFANLTADDWLTIEKLIDSLSGK